MKVYKPEVFQGKLSNRNYFEGWYYKHVSKDLCFVYSFIPGVSLNPKNPHAFIQVINGLNGSSQYVEYPISSFCSHRNDLWLQIGESVFTAESININIDSEFIKVNGRLVYSGSVKYPSSYVSPGIMGWYSFVPFMECKHGIVSVSHMIQGSLTVNDQAIDFTGGKGYIEKDWGTSFPETWFWLHSNNFANSDACIMLSIAKIPWLGSFFTGFLGFLYFGGHFYPFSTYNKSVINEFELVDEKINVGIKSKRYQLRISATLKQSGILLAPDRGIMSRRIKESLDSELEVELSTPEGHIIYSDTAKRAGLEVMEGIFDIVRIK
jgi:tocopherol cyclase